MTCKQVQELLSSYLEEELITRDKKKLEAHLKHCPDCSGILALMEETQSALRNFPEPEPSAELLSRLYSIPEKKKSTRSIRNILLHPSFQPAAAAAVILLTVVSFFTFNPERQELEKAFQHNLHLGYNKAVQLFTRAEATYDSLNEYKDEFLLSLKNIKLFSGEEE
ncbi:MAG: anti-sigma factor family protein [Acidobacteriota bacterium]